MRCWAALLMGLVGCSKGLTYEDANNYTYSGTLVLQEVPVQPASDLTITWGALDTDIRGRSVVATEIEQAAIIGLDGTYDEVRPQAERNEIRQEDAPYIYFVENAGATSAQLSSFEVTNLAIDLGYLMPDDETTWLLSLANFPDGRTDILSTVHIVPTQDSTNTLVEFTNDSASLDYEVDFEKAARIPVKAGKTPIFDWTGATKDVFGHEFSDQLGDEVILVKYDTTDLAEIEAEFLRLDSSAAELYRANVFDQTQLPLVEAYNEAGDAFKGFTEDGTWLIGVLCSSCSAPVPMILAVLDVS